MQQQKQQTNFRVRINNQIFASEVRVILEDGTSPGVVKTYEALKMARDAGLDLIEINPKSIPPVAKITDYGRFQYDKKKQEKATKQSQKTLDMKEIFFRPTTEENDMNHKLEAAKEFLKEGRRVKFAVKFKGRELTHTELGKDKLDKILEQLTDLISSFTPINLDGKSMTTIVSPK